MSEKREHTFAVTAYGQSPYLEECIRSLCKQTVKSEIVIATSTPSVFLERLSEKYRVPLAVNSLYGGIAVDWSFAYRACATKYVTLAHQDDIYLPEYAGFCLAQAKKNSGDDLIIFTDYSNLRGNKVVDIDAELVIKRALLLAFLLKPGIRSAFIKRRILSFGNPIACPSVMYNKDAIGHFEFSKNFQCDMDWDAWFRLSRRRGSFVYARRRLMLHRIHKDSQLAAATMNKIKKKEDELIFKSFWPGPAAKMLAGIYFFASKASKFNSEI